MRLSQVRIFPNVSIQMKRRPTNNAHKGCVKRFFKITMLRELLKERHHIRFYHPPTMLEKGHSEPSDPSALSP